MILYTYQKRFFSVSEFYRVALKFPITCAAEKEVLHFNSAVVFFILICTLVLQSYLNERLVYGFFPLFSPFFSNRAIRNPICPRVISNYFPKHIICVIARKKVICEKLIFICILRVVAFFKAVKCSALTGDIASVANH